MDLDSLLVPLLGHGHWLAVLAALLLGARHATDPDHLTAVASLALDERGGRRARPWRLGLAWGAGHAVTLLACGLPAVLLGQWLPEGVRRAAEAAVGVMIVALAARLLVRWRRGALHVHEHRHGDRLHAHPHAHEHAHGHSHSPDAPHAHPHAERLGRTPLASFGVGLVHGVGGSAGAGLLLVASLPSPAAAAGALVLYAGGTAASMAGFTAAAGALLGGRPQRIAGLAPLFGAFGVLFGAWYAAGALL
jgi:ABC-type nickel/cobalt efflux system permease component RcnA